MRLRELLALVAAAGFVACDLTTAELPTEPTPVVEVVKPEPPPVTCPETHPTSYDGQCWRTCDDGSQVAHPSACPVVEPEEDDEPEEPRQTVPSLTCGASVAAYVTECKRSPVDGSAWEVTVGDGRRWGVYPGALRQRIGSSGYLEALPSGSTLNVRPTLSMQAAGCIVRAHGLTAAAC